MIETQLQVPVTPETLVQKTRELQASGHRLAQICATNIFPDVQLDYSFDCAGRYTNLRIVLPAAQARVPSITGVYWAAFIYENELHDLFEVQVDGIAVDFKGTLYTTTPKFPQSCKAGPAAPAAPAPKPAPAAAPAVTPAPAPAQP